MDVESKRKLRYGFILKEADLRRLVDTVVQQLNKIPNVQLAGPIFKMKFRNGVIAQASSLDEVLAQENGGSRKIIRLSYEERTTDANPTIVSLEFINADEDDEPGGITLRYGIFGHDRDWVFVTSSLLDERLEKSKRFAPNQLAGRTVGKLVIAFALPMVLVLPIFFTTVFPGSHGPTPSEKLESARKAGQIKDASDAIIFIEHEKETQQKSDLLAPLRQIGMFAGAFVILLLIWFFFYKYYLVYNFCWGEHLEEFKKKESARKFWLVVVAVGLTLSFLGSLLANKVHW